MTGQVRYLGARRVRVEKHLEQIERRYRGLLEAAPDAMVVVSQSGVMVLSNGQAEKHFGYMRNELLGQHVTTIIPEGFAERLTADGLRTAAEAIAQQIGSGIELVARRKDGSDFPIEIMLSPLASSGGMLITAAIRDISTRKEAEKHLAHMERRYRGLLEAAPDALLVVDQSGSILLLNDQVEKKFGYRRDELLSQHVTTIIPSGFAERLIADGTRTAAEALAQQIGAGIELVARRKDGSEFPIEIMLSPLVSGEGVLVTAAIRDISVRRAAERHLAQMERRYRGLLEAAPDAIVVVDQRGSIVLLNEQVEKQFGYARNELLGEEVTSIIPHGFAERLIADGARTPTEALAQQIGAGIELVARRKDGSEFPIEIMLSPLASTDGILVTAAIRDISVRKLHEYRLEKANRAKSEFLANMSHELRTPLNAIIGFTELMNRPDVEPDPVKHKEYLGYVLSSAKHLLDLVNEVLDLAQVESGTATFCFQPVDLAALVKEVRDVVLGMGIKKDLEIQLELAEPGIVMVDPVRIKQVLFNYLSNAIKFTPEGGRIVLRVTLEGTDFFRIAVEDSGIGISREEFALLFSEFQQLDASSSKQFQGTGLGLVLTKRIVEAHGGFIEVRSSKGFGSTFCATLPRNGPRAGTVARPPRFVGTMQ